MDRETRITLAVMSALTDDTLPPPDIAAEVMATLEGIEPIDLSPLTPEEEALIEHGRAYWEREIRPQHENW